MKSNQVQTQDATIIATKNITLKNVALKRQEILNIFTELKAYKKATNASAGQPSILPPIDWTKKLLELVNSNETDEICKFFQQEIKKVLDTLSYDSWLSTALNIKCTLEGEEYNFTVANPAPIGQRCLPNKADYIEYDRLNALLCYVSYFEENRHTDFKMHPEHIVNFKGLLSHSLLKSIYTGLNQNLYKLIWSSNNIDLYKQVLNCNFLQINRMVDSKILILYLQLEIYKNRIHNIYERVSEDKDCAYKESLINQHYQIASLD